MNDLSPNKNSKSAKKHIKQAMNTILILKKRKKKEKYQTKTSYCNNRNIQQYFKDTEQHGQYIKSLQRNILKNKNKLHQKKQKSSKEFIPLLLKQKTKRRPSHCISKIQELKSLVIDLTTKNKNKMKENKDWVTNEVEHILVTVKTLALNIQKNVMSHSNRIQPIEQNLTSRKTPDATTKSISEQN